MRRVLAALLCAAFVLAFSGTTFADSERVILVSQQITITATVLPARYVIVDKDGSITRITSNTDEAVAPRTYREAIKPGNEATLSPIAQKQYEQVINSAVNKVGVLYDGSKPLPEVNKVSTVPTSKFNLFSLLDLRPHYRL